MKDAAEDAARALRRLARLDGVVVEAGGARWLLAGLAAKAAEPSALAFALTSGALPGPDALGRLLGAREVVRLDARRLGAASRALRQLGAARDLPRWIADGHPALRRWRGVDLEGWLAGRAERLGALPRAPALDDDVPEDLRGRALLRVRRLYGRGAASSAARLWPAIQVPAVPRRVVRWAALLAGERPLDEDEHRLATALSTLPADRRGALGALRPLMTAAPAPRPVPRRSIEAAVIRAWPDRRAAARAVVDLWRDALPPPSGLSLTDARARLALVLAHPRARFEGAPADAGTAAFQRWGTVLEGVDDARVTALWPAVTGADFSAWRARSWNQLLRTGEGDPVDLVRALRQNLDPDDLTGLLRGGRLGAWLEARDALAATGLPAQVSDADWLRTFFARERRWGPDLLLALLGAARDATDRAVAVEALGRALGGRAPAVQGAFAAWGTPTADAGGAEVARVAGALGVEVGRLREYAHHRTLAGEATPLPASLRAPLERADREAREAAWLEAGLADPDLPEARRAVLATRRAALLDPDAAAARHAAAVRQAVHTLDRGLEVARRASLARVLDGLARDLLRATGAAVPDGALPAGLWDALLLLRAEEADPTLVRALLSDVLAGRDLAERPPNRAWLARATFDTMRWRRGLRAEVEVAGERLVFATEHDPLAALRMGTFFDTCLSLEGGVNAASTLTNALDVNKQVIYGRRADGVVVARKLIGATADGRLAGYRLYAQGDTEALEAALTPVWADFAGACGLRLSDDATPENLHGGFWYDDGNAPWAGGRAAGEAAFVEAARRGDVGALRRMAKDGPWRWRAAAWTTLQRHHPEAAPPGDPDDDGLWIAGPLVAVGRVGWVRRLPRRRRFDDELLHALVDRGPSDADAAEVVVAQVEAMAARPGHRSDACALVLGAGWHVAGPARVLRLIAALDALVEISERDVSPADRRAAVAASARYALLPYGPTSAPALRRALLAGGGARRAALCALAEAPLAAIAPTVRATFDPDDVLAVRALGAVGDPRDGPRLLAAFEAHPDDLDRLVAVVDSGDAASIARARALFRPPADAVAWMKDEAVWRRARRAAPTALEARLRRAARRAAEDPEVPVRAATPAIEALVRLGADVADLLGLLRPLDPTSTDYLASGLPRLAEQAATPPPPPPSTPLLDGFVSAERLLRWLDAGGHADAVYEVRGLHDAGLVWALGLIDDARRAPALRRLLLDLAERGHRLAITVADTALCLLHPDEAEPIAAAVVARWPAETPLRTLDDEPPQSARLQR